MPFKFDANGAIVIDAEKKLPIFVNSDGVEAPFDADTTVANIGRLNGEAKANRIAKEAAEAALKPFRDAGLTDAAAAAAALQTVANIGSGELTTAAKVQEIKDAATRSANEAVATATRAAEEKQRVLAEQNAKLTQDLNDHIVGGSFARSKFIAEKLAIPSDIAQKVFGDRFKVDGGKLVPMDGQGNPIFSATRHGEHADFDEAMQVMISAYPNKDMILRGSGASGGGASGGNGGNGSAKQVTRAQYEAADPAARPGLLAGGAVLVD